MKILLVAKRPPTRATRGGDGDANVACAAIDELLRRGHEVTVVSFVDEHAGTPEHTVGVTQIMLPVRNRRVSLLSYPLHRVSIPAWQRSAPAATRRIQELSAQADVAWFHGVSTFGLLRFARCPVVAHEIDPMSLSLREESDLPGTGRLARVLMRRAAADYTTLERQAAATAATYLLVTEQDASDLGAVVGRRISSIPLGCEPLDTTPSRPLAERTIQVAFVGALNFAPNRHALRDYLDNVVDPLRRELGSLHAVVAGRRADEAIVDLCDGRATLLADPPDLRQIMADSRVCVFTNTFGRGERTTVREALAQGTPVAGHPWALRNLPLGPHAIVGEGEALVERLRRILADDEAWWAAAASASSAVAAMPTWAQVSARLVDRLEEAALSARLGPA